MNWQPIETYQENDGEVLVTNGESVYLGVGYYYAICDEYPYGMEWVTDIGSTTYQMTHWMRLPDPPR